MRARHCTALLVLAIGLAAASKARGEDAVGWGSSIPTAQRMAAESNRLVLVHFWSPTCKPCMKLDSEVFSMGNVGRTIQSDYVPVKINADFSPSTAVQYGVTSLPTDVIIAPSGQVITRFNSPTNAAQYMDQLRQVAVNVKSGLPVASAVAPAAAPASTVPWNGPAAGQGMVMPTAGTQPASGGLPATTSSSPLFAGAPGAAATIPAAAPAATAPAGPPAASAAAANTSPYSNDRYADYLRQRTGQGAAPTAQQTAAPNTGAAPPWPVATAAPPAAAQAPAAPWVQQTPSASAAPNQPAAQPAGFAAQPPAGNPPLGLDGYCPVRLREEYKWVLGDRRWGAIHRGRTYLFTGQAERDKFMANPDVFSPVMAGNDPVVAMEQGQAVQGQRKLGVFYGEGAAARIYMFSSDDSLKRFWDNPERYATEMRQAEAAGRGPLR